MSGAASLVCYAACTVCIGLIPVEILPTTIVNASTSAAALLGLLYILLTLFLLHKRFDVASVILPRLQFAHIDKQIRITAD